MSKKLSKAKAEVWDRLKNGIPEPVEDDYKTAEVVMTRHMAEQMAEQIDEEIIKELLDLYADSYK